MDIESKSSIENSEATQSEQPEQLPATPAETDTNRMGISDLEGKDDSTNERGSEPVYEELTHDERIEIESQELEPYVSQTDTVTRRNVQIFALYMSGMSYAQIGKKYGIGKRVVAYHVRRVREMIDGISMKDLRKGLLTLYPAAVDTVHEAISEKRNAGVAMELLKGLNILSNKVEVQAVTANVNIDKVRQSMGITDAEYDIEDSKE